MRHETLLKIIIAAFAIILIILGTFVYGNIQRSKQKTQNNSNQNTVQSPEATTKNSSDTPNNNSNNNTEQSNANNSQPNPVTPATTPSPSTSNTQANMPTTGAEQAVIPMTVLSTLMYMYFKSKKRSTT